MGLLGRLFWLLTESLKVTWNISNYTRKLYVLTCYIGISTCSFVQKTQNQRGAHQSVPAPAKHSGLSYTAHLEGGQRSSVPVEGHCVGSSASQPVPLSNQVWWVRLCIWPGVAQGRASAGAGSPAGPCRYALILFGLGFFFFVLFFPYMLNRDVTKCEYIPRNNQIMCSKQVQILIWKGGTFFFF